jgi:nucleoside 2-deoxyribosyltransferase
VGRVFLSHRLADQADADRLRGRLDGPWTVLTHTVSPAAAATWQDECRRLIDETDVVICIVGDTTAASPNVAWEIETALARGTPVIAVRAERSMAPSLPAPLEARGYMLVDPKDAETRLDEVALERAG